MTATESWLCMGCNSYWDGPDAPPVCTCSESEVLEIHKPVSPQDKLTTVFYLLMRDSVPTGALRKVLKEIENHTGRQVYTNKYLAKMATEYAANLINGDPITYGED